ncbi:hypothetical protein [Synoicihabitans lomoniglobus]|uniref:Uncharacterized protein n=1 Tax=Synoicihabitans lomoniglobus TaxID=2909285 RepID=A0AAE9ZYS8_9BACT|nr:hypothetical protein [Opitutaceae bacterium LMO-M01]WED65108.1 hypothetical protein PXH66_22450 [Opitutaceae bacterium LMO-M01]
MTSMIQLQEDRRIESSGLSTAWLMEQAAWLREQRSLHGDSCRFFMTAGSLFEFARFDYALGTVAFFHAVIGLERALKIHFRKDGHLKALFKRAIDEKVFTDELFKGQFTWCDMMQDLCARHGMKRSTGYCERLAILLPEQRNLYFHGTNLMGPDYFRFTVHVRILADALNTGRQGVYSH